MILKKGVAMERRFSPSAGGRTGIPTPKVGTNTLEKKNKALSKATKELEERMKNLTNRSRTLPQPGSSAENSGNFTSNSRFSSRNSCSLTPTRGQGRLLRELPNTPSRESSRSSLDGAGSNGNLSCNYNNNKNAMH